MVFLKIQKTGMTHGGFLFPLIISILVPETIMSLSVEI